jgi:hypothetical protein
MKASGGSTVDCVKAAKMILPAPPYVNLTSASRLVKRFISGGLRPIQTTLIQYYTWAAPSHDRFHAGLVVTMGLGVGILYALGNSDFTPMWLKVIIFSTIIYLNIGIWSLVTPSDALFFLKHGHREVPHTWAVTVLDFGALAILIFFYITMMVLRFLKYWDEEEAEAVN